MAGPFDIDASSGSIVSLNKVDDADQSDQRNVTVDFDESDLGVGQRADVRVDSGILACQEGKSYRVDLQLWRRASTSWFSGGVAPSA